MPTNLLEEVINMPKDIYLSIVIPAYNEAALLVSSIDRLKDALKQALPPLLKWEIIVCDNNSTDDTAALAKSAGAVVVHEPINQISRARNTGARAARGQWLLFLDADSYPSPALLQDIVQVSESAQYIGCGTTVIVEGGTLFNQLRMERLNPLFRILNIAGGVCLLCERQAFEQIGGFSLDLYAYEEFDFIRRLKKQGRTQGKSFTVLHQNPVVTSGRKGSLHPLTLFSMVASNIMAMLLYILRPVLPKSWRHWIGRRSLGFWYHGRNTNETK